MKNIQCLKFLTPNYFQETQKSQSYFCYLAFFKKQFSIRCRDNDELILRSEPLLLTSLSTVSTIFHVSKHIPNILKLVRSDTINLKNISEAVCLRLSNITHLTINLSKEDVSTQMIDSLGLLDNLESLKIQLSDIETLATFFELFAVNASKLLRLSELLVNLSLKGYSFFVDLTNFDTFEENHQLLKKNYKWEHMLYYFQREAGYIWRKDLKLSFCILSPIVSESDLFYSILPQKLAYDGLSVKIVSEPKSPRESYKFCFKFANEDLVLNHLEIETSVRLSLLKKLLAKNENIKTINITEKSIKSAEFGTIKYIYERFSAYISKIEKYAITLPGDSNDLLVDKIKALVSLKELTIIWEPHLVNLEFAILFI